MRVPTKHDFDRSPYSIYTYSWRWNNRKRAFCRISLLKQDLKLALE
jgi:hypothetical protein